MTTPLLAENHRQEWIESHVSDQRIIELNVLTLSGDAVLQRLLEDAIAQRQSVGYATTGAAALLRRYSTFADGGWWVSGLDPFNNWERMLWGQFKPDNPRPNPDKPGQFIKYEGPNGVPTRAIFLDTGNPTFWPRQVKGNKRIVIVEGAKKAGRLISLGYAAIALPGIWSAYRKGEAGQSAYLIPDIELIATEGREIVFCFDEDEKPKTRRNVASAIEHTAKLLRAKGCECFRTDWNPSEGKGIDDIESDERVAEIIDHAAPVRFGSRKKKKFSPLPDYALKTAPNVLLNERYIPTDIKIPEDKKLIGLVAGMGQGKTHFLAHTLGNRPLLSVTYREGLGIQLGLKLSVVYKDEYWNSEWWDRDGGVSACIDSLHPKSQLKFRAEDFKHCDVVIDEAVSVINHLLTSDTLLGSGKSNGKRQMVLQELQKLLQFVLSPESGGRVFLSDADLCEHTLNFVRELSGADLKGKEFIIKNEYRDGSWNVYSYESAPDLHVEMERQLHQGGKHLILLAAQQVKSTWGTQTLETWLERNFPHLSVLRVDRETLGDPTHPAKMDTLNETMLQYDVVICSPSIESGVSLDIYNHFSAVWLITNGSIPENSVRQFLARLRDTEVPRHIFVEQKSIIHSSYIGNNDTDERLLAEKELLKGRLNSLLLPDVDFGESLKINATAFSYWARFGARTNQGLTRYRDAVLKGLERSGHVIHPVEAELDEKAAGSWRGMMQAIASGNTATLHKNIAAAEDISQSHYEELTTRKGKTQTETQQQRKYEIKEKYQATEVTPDLINIDSEGAYRYWRVHYFLTVGKDVFRSNQAAKGRSLATDEKLMFLPDQKRLLGDLILPLQAFKIPEILELVMNGEYVHDSHPLVQESYKIMLQSNNPEIIDKLFDLEVTGKITAMSVIQNLIDRAIGFRLAKVNQKTINGKREWLYRYPTRDDVAEAEMNAIMNRQKPPVFHPFDGRAGVLDRWLDKDVQSLSSTEDCTAKLHTKTPIDLLMDSDVQSPHSGAGEVEPGGWDEESITDGVCWLRHFANEFKATGQGRDEAAAFWFEIPRAAWGAIWRRLSLAHRLLFEDWGLSPAGAIA